MQVCDAGKEEDDEFRRRGGELVEVGHGESIGGAEEGESILDGAEDGGGRLVQGYDRADGCSARGVVGIQGGAYEGVECGWNVQLRGAGCLEEGGHESRDWDEPVVDGELEVVLEVGVAWV